MPTWVGKHTAPVIDEADEDNFVDEDDSFKLPVAFNPGECPMSEMFFPEFTPARGFRHWDCFL